LFWCRGFFDGVASPGGEGRKESKCRDCDKRSERVPTGLDEEDVDEDPG